MQSLPKIVFDAERMRYAHTGLFYYCLYLGNALLQQQHEYNAQLGFYVNKENIPLFKNASFFYTHQTLHKHYMRLGGKADVWHCTFQGTNYFPASIKTKIVFTVHDVNFLHENLPAKKQKKYFNNLQKKIKRADTIIAISEFVKQDLLNNFSAEKNKIHVIYNGSNINDAVIASSPASIPASSFIFTIAAIHPKKNFHVLPALLVNNNNILIIAGIVIDADYKQKIIDHAKKLNVENRLVFTGAITESEKYWYLKNCMAFVFPSLAEGFGLPVIEAMHFGKPVILSKATSLPEIGGKHAYYFDSFNEIDMNNSFDKALKDFVENNKSEAIKNWSKKFDWNIAATQHWKIYESLL
ncbi:MAG: glycosyltransferase family 4 protein [Parafilimonas sp.]|nr:glycosyltransferase family 4 protein [Parafilimonas sp.]